MARQLQVRKRPAPAAVVASRQNEQLRHQNLAYFPNHQYSDEMLQYEAKFYDAKELQKQFTIEGVYPRLQEGHFEGWPGGSWINFRGKEEMKRIRAHVFNLFRVSAENWHHDLYDGAKICRLLAFSLASEEIERRIGQYTDNRPVFVQGNYKYCLIEWGVNEKQFPEVLAKMAEPFASAMVQSWRLLKVHELPWEFQKDMANETGALLFKYAEDLYKCSPTYKPSKYTVKCCKCLSPDASVVVY